MSSWADKFGLGPAMTAYAVDAPVEELEVLREGAPPGAQVVVGLPKTGRGQLLFFWPTQPEGLAARFQALRELLAEAGSLWVIFPKKAHRVDLGVDMTWEQMQAAALTTDLVDVKVASFSDRTYGSKFVIRRSARATDEAETR